MPTSRWKFELLGFVAILTCVGGVIGWSTDLFNYYCARPSGLVAHHTFTDRPTRYAWTQVQKVRTACRHGKGGLSVQFDVEMDDGATFGLGDDSWPTMERRYRQMGVLVSRATYYDNRRTNTCPDSLRQLFAVKPGTEVSY